MVPPLALNGALQTRLDKLVDASLGMDREAAMVKGNILGFFEAVARMAETSV